MPSKGEKRGKEEEGAVLSAAKLEREGQRGLVLFERVALIYLALKSPPARVAVGGDRNRGCSLSESHPFSTPIARDTCALATSGATHARSPPSLSLSLSPPPYFALTPLYTFDDILK